MANSKAPKVFFSNKYRQLMELFPVLPRVCEDMFLSCVKRDALRTMKNFKIGIKQNSHGLRKLKDGTITRKENAKMPQPSYPLYGKGDEFKKTSYMNMLRIRPRKDGFVVFPSRDKHHSGNIQLDRLLDIHEHGVIIRAGKEKILRGAKKKGDMIRILPRPALSKSFRQAMRERNMKETGAILKTATLFYLKTKQKTYLTKAQDYFLQGLRPYETAGR